MNKYKTINGKIRHAHGPVGMVQTQTDADGCCECGYLVCSQTGPCVPKPKGDWVYNREMDMLVYEAHIEEHRRNWATFRPVVVTPAGKISTLMELFKLVGRNVDLDDTSEDDSE
jgi:hypothetical protein